MSAAKLVFVFGFVLLFVGTGRETGITGKDEYWVTMRTPLEMMETGSLWTLRLNDEIRLQKPPLVYWFLVGAYHLFGVEVWVARLVGVLSGAGMAAITVKLHQRLFRSPALLSGIAVLATAGVAVEGRRAMLDMPLGFFCLSSVYFALSWHQEHRLWRAAASGAALAAATLSKGPQSLLFVVPALVIGWAVVRPRPPLASLAKPALLGGGVFLALALPWPISMRFLHAEFIAELQTQIVGNRLSQLDPLSPLEALGGALLLAFPWSFALLTGVFSAWRRGSDRQRGDPRAIWLCGWLLACILPFFFMRSFERYMIPILPCAALLIVWTLRTLSPRPRRALLIASTLLLAVVAVVFAGFGLWFRLTFWSSILTLGATLWMAVTPWIDPRPDRSILATAAVLALVLGVLYPRFGINRIPDDLPWEEMRNAPVGVYSRYSQPAMLSMRLQRSVDWPREHQLVERGYDGFIFTTRSQFQDPDPTDHDVAYLGHALRTAGVPFEVAGRYPVFFSRRNWIRFTRPDADAGDWRRAFRERDLAPLTSEIVFVRTGSLAKTP